jgi:hypothetical protein
MKMLQISPAPIRGRIASPDPADFGVRRHFVQGRQLFAPAALLPPYFSAAKDISAKRYDGGITPIMQAWQLGAIKVGV